MHLTPFQQFWAERARRLGLSVRIPYSVNVDGVELQVPVLLESFGARRGMLLVTDFDLIAEHTDLLVTQGFGFSCLNECVNLIEPDDALADVLADWGWTGASSPPDAIARLLSGS